MVNQTFEHSSCEHILHPQISALMPPITLIKILCTNQHTTSESRQTKQYFLTYCWSFVIRGTTII